MGKDAAAVAKKPVKKKRVAKQVEEAGVPLGCGAAPVALVPASPLKPVKAYKPSECKKVITIPQYSGTCWFNAILMSALFSQHMRGLLLHKMEHEEKGKTTELHAILWDILKRRYKTTYEMKDYAYMYFQVLTPEAILKKLHDHDKRAFNFDPKKRVGYFNYLYYPRLLEFLGARDILMLDNVKGTLYWSVVNGGLSLETVEREGKDPLYKKRVDIDRLLGTAGAKEKEHDVILVYHFDGLKHTGKVFGRGFVPADTFEHNGTTYLLDSLLLTNFNSEVCKKGHDICGITCEGDRYLYNGWVRDTVDPSMMKRGTKRELPCELMKYDWLEETGDFCLSAKMCNLQRPREKDLRGDLCFNTSKGDRIYVYVNEARSIHGKASPAPSPAGPTLAKVVAEDAPVQKRPRKKITKST